MLDFQAGQGRHTHFNYINQPQIKCAKFNLDAFCIGAHISSCLLSACFMIIIVIKNSRVASHSVVVVVVVVVV